MGPYDNLINNTALAVVVTFIFAAVYLVAGLIRPRWAGAQKRLSVVLRSVAIVLLAFCAYAGVIFYTHSQSDGPHAIGTYLKNMTEEDWSRIRGEPAPSQAPASPEAPPSGD